MLICKIVFSAVIDDVRRRPFNAAMVALTAIPACEAAIRFLGNLYDLAFSSKDSKLRHETSGNFIGAVLLTPCALDLFPGARPCGAIGFLIYSHMKGDDKSELLSSRCAHWAFTPRKIALAAAAVIGYAAYSRSYEETVSKTLAIFSRVWRKE